MAKVERRQATGDGRHTTGAADARARRKDGTPASLRIEPSTSDRRLSPVVEWPQLWIWPLLGALLLAPLRAGQLDRVPVTAVNALVAVSLLLWALLSRPFANRPVAAGGEGAGGDRLADGKLALSPTPWLALFLGLNVLSLIVSIYRHGTLTALLDLSALFGAYWLIAHGGGGRRANHWVLGAILLAGSLAALQALWEYGGRAWGEANDPGWRAFGPFFNPNLLAATGILLAPLAFGWMLRAHRPSAMVASGAGVLLSVAALLVSGSRGGALALAFGGVGFWVIAAARRLRPDARRFGSIVALLVALLPVLWLFRVPMLGRLAHVPGTPALAPNSPAAGATMRSNTFRMLTWQATLGIIGAHPVLGTGTGTFEFALPRYAVVGYTQRAHQSYLQIAAEAGVPALVAWLVGLSLVLVRLLSRHRGQEDWLIAGIGGGLLAAMAHNAVDYSWSVTGTALPFWALLGLVVALTARQGGGPADLDGARRVGGAARRSAAARPNGSANQLRMNWAAVGLAGMLLILNVVWLQAAERQDEGQAALRAGEPREAAQAYDTAAVLTPLDAALQIERANALAGSGDRAAAEAALRRATRLAPTWGRPYHRLGRLLESQGRLKEAEAAFQAASERDPRNTQPLEALATVREAAGDHAGALAAWQRIASIADDPNSQYYALDGMTDAIPALAYEALGREAETRRNDAEAIRRYRAGAERLRRWRWERSYRTDIRDARGDAGSGRELEFQRAEARLWGRLATLYGRTGQKEEATEARRETAIAEKAAGQLGGG